VGVTGSTASVGSGVMFSDGMGVERVLIMLG
jgi:hypothetical protein